MTPTDLARQLYFTYEHFKRDDLLAHNCKHAALMTTVQSLLHQGGTTLSMRELGRSVEGRSINLVSFGRGPKNVLLWSQMHGDESTATLALVDIFNFVIRNSSEPWVQEMLEQATYCCIPMVNPDGSERPQRHNAAHIDVNRDARALASPEAQVLRAAQKELQPAFGFNLHDQSLSSVGRSGAVAALALLAPAPDERKSTPLVRVRAMRLGALVVQVLKPFVEGHIATYDDAFEPRAFGDNMQAWGTSTLLIESGHWPKDPGKAFVRKLNFVAILTALRSIGNGSYQDADLDHYVTLKPNNQFVYDFIIRGIVLEHPSGWAHTVDLGLLVDPSLNRKENSSPTASRIVTIKEIGDLGNHEGLETIDATGRRLQASHVGVDKSVPLSDLLDLLQVYYS